jgi:hypothetical protein
MKRIIMILMLIFGSNCFALTLGLTGSINYFSSIYFESNEWEQHWNYGDSLNIGFSQLITENISNTISLGLYGRLRNSESFFILKDDFLFSILPKYSFEDPFSFYIGASAFYAQGFFQRWEYFEFLPNSFIFDCGPIIGIQFRNKKHFGFSLSLSQYIIGLLSTPTYHKNLTLDIGLIFTYYL